MKVLFFGTPLFSKEVLNYLIDSGIEICGVISKPDKPKGRSKTPVSTPVKSYISQFHPSIPLWQPEKVSDVEFIPVIEALKPDLFVVVAYGEILKESLLSVPKKGAINLHTSLLPKLRGAAPIQRAIMEGDKTTGITIIHLIKQMDAGDMLAQEEISILPDMTYGELEEALLGKGKKLILRIIQEIEMGNCPSVVQDPSKVTFAPKVELEVCEVIWTESALKLHNLIRGTNPEPGAWCAVLLKGEKKRLKIYKSRIALLEGAPKEILSFGKSGFIVGCKENSLELLDIQLEGKKRMSAPEFVRGLDKTALQFL